MTGLHEVVVTDTIPLGPRVPASARLIVLETGAHLAEKVASLRARSRWPHVRRLIGSALC
jgi:hypothetical protein